ncbi:MAG TPA: 4-hydroxybenzoate octaprenyltransferase [Legionellaceae bacterium]|nr:4-hydroxybenzoate octaprenyltransferase [Legionellaceae bacterium]
MNVYLRLMRFDKPAGIALLWAPTAWGLWLANQGRPDWHLVLYFLVGTIIMRAAGCIINDMVDRHIDKYVKRTRVRPLANGDLTLNQARITLVILLSVAVFILWQLPLLCWWLAVLALFITIVYPFGKRFLHAPQLILGLAFSMGIPMAYAASHVPLKHSMWVLMGLNFLWIIAYDTIYALLDRADDRRIGVHSTAILFGSHALTVILILLIMVHALWWIIIAFYSFSISFVLAWLLGLSVLIYQYVLLQYHNEQDIMRAFLANAVYGLIMWIGLW